MIAFALLALIAVDIDDDTTIVLTDEGNTYSITAQHDTVLIHVAYDRPGRVGEREQQDPRYPLVYTYWPPVFVDVAIEGDGTLVLEKRERTLLQDWTGEPDPEQKPLKLRYSWANFDYAQTVEVRVGPAGCTVQIGPDTISIKPTPRSQ